MKTDYITGAELQALRESSGLDRDQFGALCGVQGRSIKYWETGASKHGVPGDVADAAIMLADKVAADTEAQLATWKPGDVLIRAGNHHQNQVNTNILMALRKRGQVARIVALDVQAYRAWLDATKGRDNAITRQAWAREAIKEQAKPHRQDQPALPH